jgi:hypothetical protein
VSNIIWFLCWGHAALKPPVIGHAVIEPKLIPHMGLSEIAVIWDGSVRGRDWAAQITFLAFQVILEVFDAGLGQTVHAHRDEHWGDGSSSGRRSLKTALRVAKPDPGLLCLDEQLLGISIVLQAGLDLPVKLVEPLVRLFESRIGARVHSDLIHGIGALVCGQRESRHS